MERISVVIPTHNRRASAMELVSDLELQNATRFQVEVLVVSNLPDFNLEYQVMCLQSSNTFSARYLCSNEVGVNRARNLGAQSATGDVLVFLDDDCRIEDRRYLEKVLQRHKDYPQAAAVGGFYKSSKKQGPLESAYATNAQNWLEGSVFEDNKSHQLIGGNMSFKAHVLKSKVRFNEKIRFGGSETELFARLFQNGEEIRLVHDLDVIHDSPLRFKDFVRKAYMQGMGRSQIDFSARKDVNAPKAQKTNSRLQATLLTLYSFLFLWGYFYASSQNKSRRLRNFLLGFKKALAGAPEEMWVELPGLHTEYHRLRLPRFLSAKSVFHWTKGNLWKIGAWFATPLHWLKLHTWPQMISSYHETKKVSWYLPWTLIRPYHWSKRFIWPIAVHTHHFVRKYFWPPLKFAAELPYHIAKAYLIPVLSYIATRPYHIAKFLLLPPALVLFHFVKAYIYPPVRYLVSRPYNWLRAFIFPAFNYIVSRPYHWFKNYFWRVRVFVVFSLFQAWRYKVLWQRVASNLWRIQAFIHFPYHLLRLHSWKLKKVYYYFAYKSWMTFPIRKSYYFTAYQLSKLSSPRNKETKVVEITTK